MVDPEVTVDQDGFPTSSEKKTTTTTRQAPLRSRSRSTPQRTKSAADAGLSPHKSPIKASGTNSNQDRKDSKSNADTITASPSHRRSPRRAKSSEGHHDKELIDLAKAQMAMRASLNPAPSLGGEKVKMKVIVRKKKSSKDPNRSPSPGAKNRRSIKVPAGTLDLTSLDTTTKEEKNASSRGREGLQRDRRIRSSSRRSTRSRSRCGRMQSAKYNLNEDESDTEDEVEDEPDEDHREAAVQLDVDTMLQNRREQGVRTSPKAVTNSLGRTNDDAVAALLSSSHENDKGDHTISPKSSMRENGGRDRFTTASEWSNVVDDLIQKRTDGKESEKEDNKSKSKGLGRLFGSNRK